VLRRARVASALSYRDKVGSLERVRRACRTAQAHGRRVVFTNGCFDLLHPGHVRYLAAARGAGDLLVVGVNSDRSVRTLKGPGRPVQSEDARAEVLAALASVDHVVVFDAPTPLAVIERLAPDVLVKGADWAESDIVGGDLVRARGGKVVRVRLVPGQSTTRLVQRSRRRA
jgi:rfaE bifunctional protein nucleotidyltransferase chain/domain